MFNCRNVAASAFAAVLAAGAIAASAPVPAQAQQAAQANAGGMRFGIGRAPTAAEVAAWDIDVRPDGHGLRKGSGTVRAGQAIYDAQCAMCHGTFGEDNNFMVIAGGVRQEDLKIGRAAGLKEGEMRTVGTKLNHATTLFDYIHRAMPWMSPQSLTTDQTYAVTAYVLYLNEIVPEDFELNERTILGVRMPNRNGFTTAHGMRAVDGKPDVQGTLCMKDCVKDVRIASELPDYARGAHGNLAEQKRPLGPVRGIQTVQAETEKTAAGASAVVGAAAGAVR